MASRESEALNMLYRDWAAALSANPEMPLDELRLMLEHWGDVMAEPGGIPFGTDPRCFTRIRKLGQEAVGTTAAHGRHITPSWQAALR